MAATASAGAAAHIRPKPIAPAQIDWHGAWTGETLADVIEREAARRRVPLSRFVAPLSPNMAAWMRQLRAAISPKRATIERVRALIEGRDVPPPPPNNFQKKHAAGSRRATAGRAAGIEALPPIVDRDPCPRCGVRADAGCGHRGVSRILVRSANG